VFSLTGCSEATKTEDADAKTPAAGPRVLKLSPEALDKIDLKTEVVEEKPVAVPLHLTGRIEPDVHKDVNISTRIAGRITEILVTPGQTVKKGSVLAELDSSEVSDLESDLLESRSKLKIAALQEERERQIYEELLRRPTTLIRARALFNEAKVNLELYQTEFKRVKDLHAEKIVAAKDFMQAQAKVAQANTQFEEAQSSLKREEHLYQNRAMLKRDYALAQAEADRIRNHINTLTQRLVFLGVDKEMLDNVANKGQISGTINLHAPIGGIVSFREVAVGQVVQPSTTLFTVSDMSTVLIQADLPEIDLPKVKIGDRVKVKVPSYPDEMFQGTIDYMGVGVHAETRTISTRARLANPEGRLKKFMFAEIFLEGNAHKVLACPKDAIQQHGEQKIVFVRRNEGFIERQIKTGIEGDKFTEIVSGLKAGDVVATQGSLMLKNEITFASND
jgi:cobalt-zinc-cadmium efflux system membrane fusion protein